MNRRLLLALFAALLAAPSVPPAGATAETVYHRGNTEDPETLDPHKTQTVYESTILRDLFEGLTTHNAKGEIVPGSAESWTIGQDGTVYTFKIRPNAKWSNGDPVTANDFVFSLKRIMNPETGAKYATILYPIKNARAVNQGKAKVDDLGVKAIDERTLEITLESPTGYFLELLAHQTGLPVHAGSIAKFGKDFVRPENWVSNGPYVLKEFVPNAQIKAVKNPNYYDAAKAQIDTVIFYPTKDFAAAFRRFQAGEIHSLRDIPIDQIGYIKTNYAKQLRLAPYLGIYYLSFNTKKAPFSDARVRQALSMLIDREFIADKIWGSTMLPAYSFVPPGMEGYVPAEAAFKDDSPIDREEKAKKLLEEAGFGPGKTPLKVEIRYNTTDNNKATVVAIAEMWRPLGIDVSFINTDAKTHFAHLREKGDYDVARLGWIGDYSDPQNFLFLLETETGGLNYATWSNADYDKTMRAASLEIDPAKRLALLKHAETIIAAEQPYVPLLYYGSQSLVSDKLGGWEDNLRNVHPTRYLTLKP